MTRKTKTTKNKGKRAATARTKTTNRQKRTSTAKPTTERDDDPIDVGLNTVRINRGLYDRLMEIREIYQTREDVDHPNIRDIEHVEYLIKQVEENGGALADGTVALRRICNAAKKHLQRPNDWRNVAVDALLEDNTEADKRAMNIIAAEVASPLDPLPIDEVTVELTGSFVLVSLTVSGKRYRVLEILMELAAGSLSGATAKASDLRRAIADDRPIAPGFVSYRRNPTTMDSIVPAGPPIVTSSNVTYPDPLPGGDRISSPSDEDGDRW